MNIERTLAIILITLGLGTLIFGIFYAIYNGDENVKTECYDAYHNIIENQICIDEDYIPEESIVMIFIGIATLIVGIFWIRVLSLEEQRNKLVFLCYN